MIAQRLQGVPVRQLALQYGVSEVTVWRICKRMQATAQKLSERWREEQIEIAVDAVNCGLVDDSDSYKRMNGGIQVLKGLGVYAPDQQGVTVNQLIATLPAKLKAEFDEDERDGLESRE